MINYRFYWEWFVSRPWFFSLPEIYAFLKRKGKTSISLHFRYHTPNFLQYIFTWPSAQKTWINYLLPEKELLSKLSVFENAVNILGLNAQNLQLTFDSSFPSSLTKSCCAISLVSLTLDPFYFLEILSDLFLHISRSPLPLAGFPHTSTEQCLQC